MDRIPNLIKLPPPSCDRVSQAERVAKEQRISAGLDVMKVFLTVLVVVGHTARVHAGLGNVPYTPVVESGFFVWLEEFIYSFHMPAFFATSGGVYYIVSVMRQRYGDTPKFIKNKAKRLLLPFVFFTVVGVFPIAIACGFTGSSPLTYLLQLLTTIIPPRHLWYLATLFVISILFHLVEKSVLKHSLAWLCCSLTISVLTFWLPLSPTVLYTTTFHFLYFLVGFLLVNIVMERKVTPMKLGAITGGIFLICYIVKILTKTVPYFPLINNSIIAMTGTASCFFLAVAFSKSKYLESSMYKSLKKNCFGIYLFHMLIALPLYLALSGNTFSPILTFLCMTIVLFPLSILITNVFRRIGFLAVFIGENRFK